MPLSPYVRLHCSRINLCHSKLSVFPLLSLVFSLCGFREIKSKSRTDYFKSKAVGFPQPHAVRYHIRHRRIFHLRLAADITAAQPLYHCDVSDIASLSQVLKADIEDFLHMVISEGIVDGLGFTAEFDQIGKP